MPIQYALFENNVTADPKDYAATVQISGSADGDDLAQDIVDQGTTVNKPDILAVTAALKLACQRRVEQGQRVNYFGMVEFFPRIKGVFTGATDTFDPARHRIDIGANPGSELREAVRTGATVEKVEAVKPSPNPIEYRDIGSDTTNDQVTPGNIGQLSGSRLKYDEGQADEGVFFVPALGGATKVATVQKNKPSQGVFLVPAGLVAGAYNLEVRARIGGGTELRIGRLDPVLTVYRDKLGKLGGLCGVFGRQKTVSKLDSGSVPSLASAVVPKPGLGIEVNLTSDPTQLGYGSCSTRPRTPVNLTAERGQLEHGSNPQWARRGPMPPSGSFVVWRRETASDPLDIGHKRGII